MSPVKWVTGVECTGDSHLAQAKNSKVLRVAGPMTASQRHPSGPRCSGYKRRQGNPHMKETKVKFQGGPWLVTFPAHYQGGRDCRWLKLLRTWGWEQSSRRCGRLHLHKEERMSSWLCYSHYISTASMRSWSFSFKVTELVCTWDGTVRLAGVRIMSFYFVLGCSDILGLCWLSWDCNS